MRHGVIMGLLLALVMVGADAAASVALPSASAPPAAVLRTYLAAFRAGDCDTARALWVRPHVAGGGDLGGEADLRSFAIVEERAGPFEGQMTIFTRLTTDGSRDGSLPPGSIPWTYYLARQAGGAWRIVGGGQV